MLHETKSREVLEKVIARKIPVVMTHLSGHRWQVQRVILTDLGTANFEAAVTPQRKFRTFNLEVSQSVGISFKYGFGRGHDKYIFDTNVTGFGVSPDKKKCETIKLLMPKQIELVPKRSFSRITVPKSLDVEVQFWHRYCKSNHGEIALAAGPNWQGKLIDISASGLQIAVVPKQGEKLDFEKGQIIGLKFTPIPYETPLMFNARIQTILPTADNESICLGLQMIGLEASPEGRMILSRLVGIVDQYHQISQSEIK